MLVMGISGGVFRTHEDGSAHINRFAFHDAAAVLIDNGEVVAAIEQERLNRIKHTNKIPLEAMRSCLDSYGARIQDLDYVAYYSEERHMNSFLGGVNLRRTLNNEEFEACWDFRILLRNIIEREYGYALPVERLQFVNHHLAHALSAFLPSGFDSSLVFTIDGQGDNESGRVLVADGQAMELLKVFPVDQSLGSAYGNLINLIGFQQFDEYKVMGLAPYGDPARYGSAFSSLYTLLPDGDYAFNYQNWEALYSSMRPRKKNEEITQHHKDLAAALQTALEEIVFHVLTHYQKKTRQRNLCLAGGVAHNCTLNGKILYSGLFSKLFVQPAAHDAGCALGAALSVYLKTNPRGRVSPLSHLYWGTDIGSESEILKSLAGWQSVIKIEKEDAICQRAARLIADGAVIGWVQGRSEFGPRALGNRSILADPRPAENKQIINAMVKKREGFRPFAPSILEEDLKEFYDIDGSSEDFSFMNYVVKVRPEKQKLLGAVTHVDGTARIQKVSRGTNKKYWDLISAFKSLTGVPILLNTSFNNNAEPIVDSIEDAVACFLTAKLHYLVVGDFLISKKDNIRGYLELVPSLPGHLLLMQVKRVGADGKAALSHEFKNNVDPGFKLSLSPEVFDLLVRANGQETLADLLASSTLANKRTTDNMVNELQDLWSRRVIKLKPLPAGAYSHESK